MSSDYCPYCLRGDRQLSMYEFLKDKVSIHMYESKFERIPLQKKFHKVAAIALIIASEEAEEVQQ